jgi:hypothetical protein
MKSKLMILAFFILGSILVSFTFSERSTNLEHNHKKSSYPCHPGGDIYPCSHPVHLAGDVGPCTHYNVYGNQIHWRGDIYPCSHPVHPVGDVGPCTHICW